MPNVIFMDGFDIYDASKNNTQAPGFHSKWIISSGENITFWGGRYGGQCLHIGNSVFGNRVRAYFADNKFYQSATVGFAIMFPNIAGAAQHEQTFTFQHNQSAQIGFDVTAIGQPRLLRGTTVLAIGDPNVFHSSDWHYVEIEYLGHNTNGRATVYVDGVEVLNFVGNTQAQAAYGFNGFSLSGGSGHDLLYDDLYVIDSATRLGERRIETLRPNGDVQGNTFLPSTGETGFEMLDDAVVNAADYVSATEVGAKDLYNFTNLTTSPNKIDAVQLTVWANKTDAETRQLKTVIRSGAVETDSRDYNLPSSHLNMNRIENLNPSGNVPWTTTAVNALRAGFKITK